MKEKNQVTLGIVIAVLGIVLLLGSLLGVRLWRFIWPVALVGLGLYFVLRPRLVDDGAEVDLRILGDVRRKGSWEVKDQEIWVLIGDTRLDLREATIPMGETRIRVYGMVGDLKVRLPRDVAVSVSTFAMVTDADVLGRKQDSFFAPVRYASPDYDTTERRIRLETGHLVLDLDIEQD